VTITVPYLLRQRIPPLLLRARGRALSQDFQAPPLPPPPPTPPTCLNPGPSYTIRIPRLLLRPSPQPSNLDDSIQQPSPWETALPYPLQSALRAAYLPIQGLATKHPQHYVQGVAAPLRGAHRRRPDTRVERVHSDILCPPLMHPRHLLERTASHGMHRPLVGGDTTTAFNPLGAPRKGRHLTDPRAPLLPGYLAMLPAMIPPAHHHQSITIRP
jgi:hypothetical protein